MHSNSKTFGFHFCTKPVKKRKDGKVPIYVRITLNGKRTEFSLNRNIQQEQWCKRTKRAHHKYPIAKWLNPHLEKVATELRTCYESFVNKQEYVTAQLIKTRYLGQEEEVSTLMGVLGYHREEELQKLSPGTAKNYRATETYLKRFVKSKYKTDDVNLVQINYAFISQFENYLRTCRPIRTCQPLTNNGIMKHMERFQKMMGLAYKFDWIGRNPFKRYRLKFDTQKAEFLELGELNAIAALEPNKPRLRLSKDLFVFASYTGLSYIEVKHIKKGNLVTGVDGSQWIATNRQKTKTPVKVPLLGRAEQILEKYRDFADSNGYGLLLPCLANPTLNRDLKDLAEMAGIEKHLTFHVARHTFATTITLTNGVPVETVSKLLGHTKLSTTKRYARVVEQKISHDIAALRKKMEDPNKVSAINAKEKSRSEYHTILKVVK